MGRDIARIVCCAVFGVAIYPGVVGAEETAPLPIEQTPAVEVSQPAAIKSVSVSKDPPLFRYQSYPEAWKASQKSNRPILVYVCMPNCPHCVKMLEQTYETPKVGKLVTSSFETIHVGRYSHATLVKKMKIKWYPTTVLVGPNNKVLDMIEGYVDANRFQQRLQTGIASVAPVTQTR